MTFDALGLGLCAWDRLLLLSRYPGPNQKVEAIGRAEMGGGPVPTALAVFSRLGGRAAFLGAVGDDAAGELVRRDLEKYGVDTLQLRTRKGRKTAIATIWVDAHNGDRTVALDRGDAEPPRPEELPEALIRRTPRLLLDGRDIPVNLAAARWCRESGGTVILDAGSPRRDLEALLPLTCHAVVSLDFMERTFPGMHIPEAMFRLQALGPPSVVVTCGAEGGYWREGDHEGNYPAFAVEVVDTTGAGDAFHGGYLWGLAQGWDMPERCRRASAVAALVCRDLGGRSRTPVAAEVTELLNRTG
ncbi:MAG: sugar kinase [Candidatus Zixiibacteriota bacterium]|nr:MAG: sugar kinase [candidate division Zixibacteria bacterium]